MIEWADKKKNMRRFKSIEQIKEATVLELKETESMNEQAEAVYAFFSREKEKERNQNKLKH